MTDDENNMAEAAAREYERGAARDYAAVQRSQPRHCHWCGWRLDSRIFYSADPLRRCVRCGLWLCAACEWSHDCPAEGSASDGA
jgi:hypothetical protein